MKKKTTKTSEGNCLCCNERPQSIRGLCKSCYAVATLLVKGAKTTWVELEKAGKCFAPSQKKGLRQHYFLNP